MLWVVVAIVRWFAVCGWYLLCLVACLCYVAASCCWFGCGLNGFWIVVGFVLDVGFGVLFAF